MRGAKGTRPPVHVKPAAAHSRGQAFLLMFRDGSLLPLHIHACEGGTRLMEELKATIPQTVAPTPGDPKTDPPAFELDGKYYILASKPESLPNATGILTCWAVQTAVRPHKVAIVEISRFVSYIKEPASILPTVAGDLVVTLYTALNSTAMEKLAQTYQAATSREDLSELQAGGSNANGHPYLLIWPEAASLAARAWLEDHLQGRVTPGEALQPEMSPAVKLTEADPTAAWLEDLLQRIITSREAASPPVLKYANKYYALQGIEKDEPVRVCRARCFDRRAPSTPPRSPATAYRSSSMASTVASATSP